MQLTSPGMIDLNPGIEPCELAGVLLATTSHSTIAKAAADKN
jgi:hypothetical protein